MLCHLMHLLDCLYMTRSDLFCTGSNETEEITFGERVSEACVMEAEGNGLFVGLLGVVDLLY